MQKRIYLASPYTSPDPQIRKTRYEAACAAAAQIMAKGDLVFSPIAHSHVLPEYCDLPVDFDFWQNWCLSFLRHWATHFVILEIPGWDKSKGIMKEHELAVLLDLDIVGWPEILEQKNG